MRRAVGRVWCRADGAVRGGEDRRSPDPAARRSRPIVGGHRPVAGRRAGLAVVGDGPPHAGDAALARPARRRDGAPAGGVRRDGRRQRPVLGRDGVLHGRDGRGRRLAVPQRRRPSPASPTARRLVARLSLITRLPCRAAHFLLDCSDLIKPTQAPSRLDVYIS